MSQKKLHRDIKYFESFEEIPLLVAIVTYISYGILIIFGHLRELLRKCSFEKVPIPSEYLTQVILSSFHLFFKNICASCCGAASGLQ